MRINICDSDQLFGEALSWLLVARGYEVTNADSTILDSPVDPDAPPDVIVTDLDDDGGSDFIQALRTQNEAVPITIFTDTKNPVRLREAMLAGADGVVLKSEGIGELERILKSLVASRTTDHRRTGGRRTHEWSRGARALLEASERSRRRGGDVVTPKERQVLERLIRGDNTAAIARALGVGEATVRTHLQNLFLKFGVHSRLGLIACALRVGIVQVEAPLDESSAG